MNVQFFGGIKLVQWFKISKLVLVISIVIINIWDTEDMARCPFILSLVE